MRPPLNSLSNRSVRDDCERIHSRRSELGAEEIRRHDDRRLRRPDNHGIAKLRVRLRARPVTGLQRQLQRLHARSRGIANDRKGCGDLGPLAVLEAFECILGLAQHDPRSGSLDSQRNIELGVLDAADFGKGVQSLRERRPAAHPRQHVAIETAQAPATERRVAEIPEAGLLGDGMQAVEERHLRYEAVGLLFEHGRQGSDPQLMVHSQACGL